MTTNRPRRSAGVCVSALVLAALVLAQPANAAITWGGTRNVGPPSTWSPGNTLAHAGGRLLTAWASDCPPPKGRCATDSGPHMGVFVQRTALGGNLKWSDPIRVSQGKSQAERASIAADGQLAIVGWVTQRSYSRYDGGAPRAFYVRRSTDRGASWSKAIRITAPSGRVDYPQLAVSDGTAYAAWTNADSGSIRLATSTDGGRHWSTRTIGTTTSVAAAGEGFAGYPTVGASGMNVVVAWFADEGGTQVAKSSASQGADFDQASPFDTLTATSPNDGLHYGVARGAADGVTNDVTVAYTTSEGIAVRLFDGFSLGGEVTVLGGGWPIEIRGRTYTGATGPVIEPFGSGGLTVAFSACRDTSLNNDCRSTAKGARIDLFSTSSNDGGAGWSTPSRLGVSRGSATRVNDAAGLVVTRPDERFVLWNARDERFLSYRMTMRIGTGLV
ncbi:MAG TPA: sialidase family protein [Actinomycetota bacterium]